MARLKLRAHVLGRFDKDNPQLRRKTPNAFAWFLLLYPLINAVTITPAMWLDRMNHSLLDEGLMVINFLVAAWYVYQIVQDLRYDHVHRGRAMFQLVGVLGAALVAAYVSWLALPVSCGLLTLCLVALNSATSMLNLSAVLSDMFVPALSHHMGATKRCFQGRAQQLTADGLLERTPGRVKFDVQRDLSALMVLRAKGRFMREGETVKALALQTVASRANRVLAYLWYKVQKYRSRWLGSVRFAVEIQRCLSVMQQLKRGDYPSPVHRRRALRHATTVVRGRGLEQRLQEIETRTGSGALHTLLRRHFVGVPRVQPKAQRLEALRASALEVLRARCAVKAHKLALMGLDDAEQQALCDELPASTS